MLLGLAIMNFFCENCGYRLSSNDMFCENCGTKNAAYSAQEAEEHGLISIFNDRHWEKKWENVVSQDGHENVGIIMINYDKFTDSLEFYKVLEKYIQYKKNQNIHYYLLNLADQEIGKVKEADCEKVVSILSKICKCAKPKYLMIVGDRDFVGSIKWNNPAYDSKEDDGDKYVDSDLPYVTLDTRAPNKGQKWEKYDFTGAIRTGRVLCNKFSEFEDACTYFNNVMGGECRFAGEDMFGISAKSWVYLSSYILSKVNSKVSKSNCRFCPPSHKKFRSVPAVKRIKKQLQISPPVVLENSLALYQKEQKTDLLYFNLHGSNYKESLLGYSWYGEDPLAGEYPVAYNADCLPRYNGYVIGCEACYGAIPYDREGILPNALRNGCFAFLGSHQIAFGGSVPEHSCCADEVVGDFLLNVSKGYTVGDAYLMSLSKYTSDRTEKMDDAELTTLAEFALYGDPSLRSRGNSSLGGTSIHSQEANMPYSKSLEIMMPDVRGAVALKLARVNDTISKSVQAYVKENFAEYECSTPNFYEVMGVDKYQASFKKITKKYTSYLKVYFDKTGQVTKVYQSK